ncbi:hypothetical protein [Alishewanella tabrizica]|uniref:Cohesin domain-containing protein n=1 Tax=Alishewanella tabrizica TaxID=671278 RepID=A0ABQ2WLB9_9ALTE|nr:hypothetical protein [Alishewanella tabrizica]GGW57655.1 hypothetical protein GCM10008111_12180 [Alishewanella tabrizica]
MLRSFIVFFSLCIQPAVNASPIDITAPKLLGLTISPNTVNVSSGNQMVDVSLEFTEDLSGLQLMSMSVFDPSGTYVNSTYTNFIEGGSPYLVTGDQLGGILDLEFAIPQYAESGDYTYSILLRDNNNNDNWIDYSELVSMGFGNQLSVISDNQDLTSPKLLGFTISPNTVNVSSGNQTVDFSLEFTEDLSGLQLMSMSVFDPSGTYVNSAYTNFIDGWSPYLVTGDQLGGILDLEFVIPQYAESGDYTYNILLRDNNNNDNWIDYSELVSMGFGNMLKIRSATSVSEPPAHYLILLPLLLLLITKILRKGAYD